MDKTEKNIRESIAKEIEAQKPILVTMGDWDDAAYSDALTLAAKIARGQNING